MSIVDGGDARDDTGFVVEDGFNDVRGHTQHRHVGRHRPAQVVETPVLGICKGSVQTFLETAKAGDRCRARGREYEVRVLKARDRLQDVDRQGRERNDMGSRVLDAGGWQVP